MQLGEWQQVGDLQEQQQGLLKQLDSMKVPADVVEQAKIEQLSLQIQALTEQQLLISHARKDKLLTEIKKSNKSKQMNNAYNQNS
ncbi:MAG: hypothetical protein OFPI_38590 [Osedax symbiont Rs2]|nr:MAG: hypothetical protein OFPI_38590 [Osedax symbiont Rs2]